MFNQNLSIMLESELNAAHRQNGYLLAVLDIQEILLEAKNMHWMNPDELFSHLANQIDHATKARELNNFTPEKEYYV